MLLQPVVIFCKLFSLSKYGDNKIQFSLFHMIICSKGYIFCQIHCIHKQQNSEIPQVLCPYTKQSSLIKFLWVCMAIKHIILLFVGTPRKLCSNKFTWCFHKQKYQKAACCHCVPVLDQPELCQSSVQSGFTELEKIICKMFSSQFMNIRLPAKNVLMT